MISAPVSSGQPPPHLTAHTLALGSFHPAHRTSRASHSSTVEPLAQSAHGVGVTTTAAPILQIKKLRAGFRADPGRVLAVQRPRRLPFGRGPAVGIQPGCFERVSLVKPLRRGAITGPLYYPSIQGFAQVSSESQRGQSFPKPLASSPRTTSWTRTALGTQGRPGLTLMKSTTFLEERALEKLPVASCSVDTAVKLPVAIRYW